MIDYLTPMWRSEIDKNRGEVNITKEQIKGKEENG